MAQTTRRIAAAFLDTAYAIALSNEDDDHHARALDLSLKLEAFGRG